MTRCFLFVCAVSFCVRSFLVGLFEVDGAVRVCVDGIGQGPFLFDLGLVPWILSDDWKGQLFWSSSIRLKARLLKKSPLLRTAQLLGEDKN